MDEKDNHLYFWAIELNYYFQPSQSLTICFVPDCSNNTIYVQEYLLSKKVWTLRVIDISPTVGEFYNR